MQLKVEAGGGGPPRHDVLGHGQLSVQHGGDGLGGRFPYVRHTDGSAQLQRERARSGIGDAAGHDPVVLDEVGIAVEREAVLRHPTLYAHADRTDLALRADVVGGQPDAAAAVDPARRGEPEIMAHADQRLLQPPHEVDDVERLGERHDGVADELAGAVPGDTATPVDVDDGGAVGGPVLGPGALTGGVDGWVLQQHQHIRSGALTPGGGVGALHVPGGHVVDGAQPVDPDGVCGAAAGPAGVTHTHDSYATPGIAWPGTAPCW